MMTYVCDKCLKNRSDEGEVYHLTVTKIENVKNVGRIVKEVDICAPCFTKMMEAK